MRFGIGMVGCRLLPARENVLQVPLKQREQIVLRVILVVIGDACEIERHGESSVRQAAGENRRDTNGGLILRLQRIANPLLVLFVKTCHRTPLLLAHVRHFLELKFKLRVASVAEGGEPL